MALNNIPPLTLWLPGVGAHAFWKKPENYWLVLSVTVVSYILVRRLVHSRAGRAMIALRENEPLATSLGIDVTRYLVLAAVVSAAIAGAAGGLYAHFVRIIDPDIFLFIYTVTMVIMVITGGKGTLAGPLVGGLIFGMLPVALRAFASPVAQWIIYGVLMVLVVFFLPRGIVPAVSDWWTRRQSASVHPSTPLSLRSGRTAEAKDGNGVEGWNGAFPHPLHRARQRAFRRPRCRRRHELRRERRRAREPDRAERGRENHRVQRRHRVPEATRGTVRYRGVSLTGLKSHEVANLGLVRTFQKTSVFGAHTVLENMLIGLHRLAAAALAMSPRLPLGRAEERALAAEVSPDPRVRRPRAARPSSAAPCPTASSGCSRSRSRSPRGRRSFCSTSRSRA